MDVLQREWGMADGRRDGVRPAAGTGGDRTSCSALVVAWDMPWIVLHVPVAGTVCRAAGPPKGLSLYAAPSEAGMSMPPDPRSSRNLTPGQFLPRIRGPDTRETPAF